MKYQIILSVYQKFHYFNHSVDYHLIYAIYKLNHLIVYTFQCKSIFTMQVQYQEKFFRETIFTLECI